MNGLWLGLRSIKMVLQEINEKIMVKTLENVILTTSNDVRDSILNVDHVQTS